MTAFEEAFEEFKTIQIGHANLPFNKEDLALFMWTSAIDQCIKHYINNPKTWEYNIHDDGSIEQLIAEIENIEISPQEKMIDDVIEDLKRGSE